MTNQEFKNIKKRLNQPIQAVGMNPDAAILVKQSRDDARKLLFYLESLLHNEKKRRLTKNKK